MLEYIANLQPFKAFTPLLKINLYWTSMTGISMKSNSKAALSSLQSPLLASSSSFFSSGYSSASSSTSSAVLTAIRPVVNISAGGTILTSSSVPSSFVRSSAAEVNAGGLSATSVLPSFYQGMLLWHCLCSIEVCGSVTLPLFYEGMWSCCVPRYLVLHWWAFVTYNLPVT